MMRQGRFAWVGDSPGFGDNHLTRRHRSALVAALACASLFVATLAAQAAPTRGGAKSSPAATAKAAGKAASREAHRKEGGKGQVQEQQIDLSQDRGAAGTAGAGTVAPDFRRRDRAGQERNRRPAQRRRQQGDQRPGHHLGPGGAQARRMDHLAQRPQRRQQHALPRLYRRQSELAEPRNVSPPRRGDALGRECQADASPELLQRLAAAVGHGPPGPGARAPRAGRHRRRERAGARGLAQRSVVRRCREAGARALFRVFEPRRSQGAHGEKTLRRRQRSRDAGGAPAGGRRRCNRAGAHRAQPQGRQCQKARCQETRCEETARRRAGGSTPRCRLYLRARARSAPRRQDRRGRAGDAVRAPRPCPDPRSGGVVGRKADHVAQASRSRRCPLCLPGGGGRGRADQGKLPGRAPFHGGLDRAAFSR